MDKSTHLIKLSVGTESVEGLAQWQAHRRRVHREGLNRHTTRMWPRRDTEVLNGGSIYWVIKGLVQCRQRLLRFEETIGEDGIRRCTFVLDPELIRTQIAPKRAFQGWRYLDPSDAPPDLPTSRQNDDPLPVELNQALAEIGVV